MACFIVPTIIGGITHHYKKEIPKNLHIEWFNIMVFGGAVGLAVEHIAHQEIVPWFPFLTAINNPASIMTMLKEMITVGAPMTIGLIAVWATMVIIYEKFIVAKKSPVNTAVTR